MDMWFIKVLFPDSKAWRFVGDRGATRLRIHALMYSPDKVDAAVEELRKMNPDMEFRKQHV